MPFCEDGRWHATQREADACRHHKDDKDFRTVNKSLPSCAAPKKRKARISETIEEDTEDEGDDGTDLPQASPLTPTPKPKPVPASKSPSPSAQQLGYPTPPLTHEAEDMDDNIVVAIPASSQMACTSPMPAVRRQSQQCSPSCGAQPTSSNRGTPEEDDNDLDDIPGPLSSSPPPPAASRSPSPAQSAADTSRVPETVIEATNNPTIDDDASNTSDTAELNNTILTLRADRARLTDALSTSTFRTQNLLTRARLQRIETQLARAEMSEVQAHASTAWEAVDAAREARKNAWMSVAIVMVLVLGYAGWCWWYSVEMKYVRGRRCGVYGLGVDC